MDIDVMGNLGAVIISGVLTLIKYVSKKNGIGRKHWKCEYKSDSASKYSNFIVISLLFPIILLLFLGIFAIIGGIKDFVWYLRVEMIFIYIVIGITMNIIDNKKKIFIIKKKNKCLYKLMLNAPLFMSVWLCVVMSFEIENGILIGLPSIILIICQTAGLFVMDNKIIYQYKNAVMYLKDGTKIKDLECQKIILKGKWFKVILPQNEELRINVKQVKKIKYCKKQY